VISASDLVSHNSADGGGAIAVIEEVEVSVVALVIASVNAWVATPVPLLAVKVSGYSPTALPSGVPARTAVPLG
jgi:hypothetical protein